jgi:hypothetical protein
MSRPEGMVVTGRGSMVRLWQVGVLTVAVFFSFGLGRAAGRASVQTGPQASVVPHAVLSPAPIGRSEQTTLNVMNEMNRLMERSR